MYLLTVFLATFMTCGETLRWKQELPIEFKDVVYSHNEEKLIRKIYHDDNQVDNDLSRMKRYALHKVAGDNCGSTKLPIIVNSLTLPDVIVLGENATVSLDATIGRLIKDVSLVSVVAQKVGIPVDIPCMDNIGTCNYTNTCELLKQFQCPPEVIKQGWNCRCPLKPMEFILPKTVVAVPSVPLPAFLVDGHYTVQVRMYEGATLLMCYKLQITLKEK